MRVLLADFPVKFLWGLHLAESLESGFAFLKPAPMNSMLLVQDHTESQKSQRVLSVPGCRGSSL